jgi:tRNA1Val (adenine37-N6)-methyltransferase
MKVCTDACLFGAWVSKEIENIKVEKVLDIGTGTAVLSLMLAQKSSAIIDAVEVDTKAAEQAEENFKSSPWRERLKVFNLPIQQLSRTSNDKYDVIISNPPFFNNSLTSSSDKKNLAKHTGSLSFEELVDAVLYMMTENGSFYVLLSFNEFDLLKVEAAKRHLFLQQRINIRQTPRHSFFRSIGSFSTTKANIIEEDELKIKELGGEYSGDFVSLLKDYYLHL